MKTLKTILSIVVMAFIAVSCKAQDSNKDLQDGLYAKMQTSKGTILIKLEFEKTPLTVANFVGLAEGKISNNAKTDGVPYYDGLTFHRVIPDFVIQGGCPDGTGAGGPGYSIDCELDGDNQFHDKGILSMAHAGRNTGGSQFFICHSRNNTAHLDRNHTCFGKVVEGLDIIDTIKAGDKINKIEIIEA